MISFDVCDTHLMIFPRNAVLSATFTHSLSNIVAWEILFLRNTLKYCYTQLRNDYLFKNIIVSSDMKIEDRYYDNIISFVYEHSIYLICVEL